MSVIMGIKTNHVLILGADKRLSTFKGKKVSDDGDKILVINDGKVEGFAPHKELIKISSLYKHMVQIQKFEERMEGDV